MSVEPVQGRYVDTELVQLVISTLLSPELHQPGAAGLPMLVVGEAILPVNFAWSAAMRRTVPWCCNLAVNIIPG
jgi:hypothetical protein